MSKKNHKLSQGDPLVFTSSDRLQLLQLTTRRVMADRRVREFDAEERPDLESPEEEGTPGRWRLVPTDIQLWDWQKECLPLWMERGRGTVKVATGGGKTLFALAVAQELQNTREPDLRLVIVVPTIPLMFQWRDELRIGSIPDSSIGMMGGAQDLPPLDDIRVLICVLNSAREKLPKLISRAGWSQRMLLVVDECHRANAERARRIFDSKPKYALGLSATPEQDEGDGGSTADEAYEASAVGQALGPIIYDFTIRQSLEAGLLTPFEVWHVGLPLSPQEANEYARFSREIADLRKSLQVRHRSSRSKQGFIAWCQTQASRGGRAAPEAERFVGLANRRKRLLYSATARTDVALGFLSEAADDLEAQAIVFHESIDDIERLFLRAIERRLPAVLEHSQLPDSLRAENIEAFRQGIARIIISAKSLVEGFNVPSADLGIIAASSGSVRQRIQSLGRMLRRKPGGRSARIVVLYVRDTEDDRVYEKADWENVIGAERNRYFCWTVDEAHNKWGDGLEETGEPPRIYRPPSTEIDAGLLKLGDSYPAQTHGSDLRVDQSENLRMDDGTLVPASKALVKAILEYNPHRRARRTPAGHLITRADRVANKEPDWRFLDLIDLPETPDDESMTRLRLRSSSGRRVIALEGGSRDAIPFALGPDKSRRPEAGQARDRLLKWVSEVEAEQSVEIKEIFWNNEDRYWLEIGGKRIQHDAPLAPLEFPE